MACLAYLLLWLLPLLKVAANDLLAIEIVMLMIYGKYWTVALASILRFYAAIKVFRGQKGARTSTVANVGHRNMITVIGRIGIWITIILSLDMRFLIVHLVSAPISAQFSLWLKQFSVFVRFICINSAHFAAACCTKRTRGKKLQSISNHIRHVRRTGCHRYCTTVRPLDCQRWNYFFIFFSGANRIAMIFSIERSWQPSPIGKWETDCEWRPRQK